MVQLSECKLCHEAKSDTPQSWMQHIATYHIIPTEWPSERAKRLTGTDALRPYSTVADSKKKRKKDSVARPLNSFMIFSQYIRRNVLEVFKEHANADMSKQLGKLWGNLDDHFKDQYHEEAERMARLHDLEFPDYKYQPRKGKRNEHQMAMQNSNDLYKQSISANLIQHQMSQNNSPISVVTSTVPLIITSSAFPSISKSNKTFEHSKETVQTKHILCNPTNTAATAFTTQGHISYISGSSDSAYSSEIGSCSSSSVPSPAIGDFLIQSPMKHYVDERGSSLHHWNVDGRRFFQTPRQASSSSMPEYYTDIAAPNNSNINNNEIKTFRKRFYSGTHDVHFSKIPCIAETEEETSIELDVVDQNGNKMKLRIENGSKEILKNLLLNDQDGQNIKQKQVQDQIYLQQQQQSNESNCQYITDGSNNYAEYVIPINAQQEISTHMTNGRVQLSPMKMADNSPAEQQQQHATIFAYIPDPNFSNVGGQTTNSNQQIQLIRTANGNQFENGQIIMINQDFIRANQDLRNEINNSILSGNAGIINTGNIHQYQLACGKTLEGLTLETALPSDLAALDTSSLYRIN